MQLLRDISFAVPLYVEIYYLLFKDVICVNIARTTVRSSCRYCKCISHMAKSLLCYLDKNVRKDILL